MPAPGIAEPDELPFLQFRLDDVEVISSTPPNPTRIVQSGDTVELRTILGLRGFWTGFLLGESFNVFHHVTRKEDNTVFTLAGGTFAVPATAAAADTFDVTSGPYTTGPGADFPTDAAFSSNTFEILTHIHFVDPGKEPIVTAFHTGYLMVA